jgi:hypothetical protein
MTPIDDDLLTALRAARPATSEQPSAASPEATATLTRILQTPRAPARRQRRSRRWFLRLAIPVTAAVAAAVTLAVTLSSSGTPSINPAVARVRIAVLDAFQRDSGHILYAAYTSKSPKGVVVTQRKWTYPAFPVAGQQVKYRVFSFRSGAPTEDSESVYTENAAATNLSLWSTQGPRSAEVTAVVYATKTWSKQRTSSFPLSTGLSPSLIKNQIASGDFALAGQGRADGRQALKLTWLTRFGSVKTTTDLWVDARTYQPLRDSSTMRVALRNREETLQTQTTDFRILAATPANLRLLSPPIPPGFTRTATPRS